MVKAQTARGRESYAGHPVSIPTRLIFHSLLDDVEGFRVLLEDEDGWVYRVSFDSVVAYRKSSEVSRFRSLGSLRGDDPTLDSSLVYLVKESEFIGWINDELLGANKYGERGLQHWAIIALDQWIDVLSFDLPEVNALERDCNRS